MLRSPTKRCYLATAGFSRVFKS